MKKFKLFALMFAVTALFAACGDDENDNNGNGDDIQTFTVEGVDFTMVKVNSGTFTMGAMEGDLEVTSREKPAHQVTLTKDFYIGQTEVTQELYQAVMGVNPSYFSTGGKLPVEHVSYNDAIEFCSRLSNATGRTFTLPTEAQWEYAARGGHKAPATPTIYAGSNDIDAVTWWYTNTEETQNVGGKAANELGLYDMSGNVREWCLDWYGDYTDAAQTDPQGPSTGTDRVSRGGSWACRAYECRTTWRFNFAPGNIYGDQGLRVVMIP